MKKKNKEQRRSELLHCVCTLPRKMTQVHGTENLTEFLLHHLADQNCFNLSKAAYFVDNPDFDHFKGVAGFHRLEAFSGKEHWDAPHDFTQHMRSTSFNRRVRSVGKKSHKRLNAPEHELVGSLSQELELEQPSHHIWPMKYDNHGVFIFELADSEDRDVIREALEEAVYLFGFCPIF